MIPFDQEIKDPVEVNGSFVCAECGRKYEGPIKYRGDEGNAEQAIAYVSVNHGEKRGPRCPQCLDALSIQFVRDHLTSCREAAANFQGGGNAAVYSMHIGRMGMWIRGDGMTKIPGEKWIRRSVQDVVEICRRSFKPIPGDSCHSD